MPGPVQSNVLCRTLIGREAYLEQFAESLQAAAGGKGSVIAISGEAGIGKSRLVAELDERAQSHEPSFEVAHGNCFEFDTVTPFAPLLDLFRSCIRSRDAAQMRSCTEPDGAMLLRILPELASVLPELQPAAPREPEQDKRLIFTALANAFCRFAEHAPLLMTVEDMHWCDDTTIEFLEQFGRRASEARVVIVITFRSDEVSQVLRKLLASFDRQRIVRDWRLVHLSQGEVSKMLVSIFDLPRAPAPAITARIHALTEGNPFFIEEVLKSLAMTDGGTSASASDLERITNTDVGVPRSVHAAMQERLLALSEVGRQVVEIAAVAGRRFDFALLERLTSLSERQLLAVIKELITAQLVAEESADHFVFRHALTQQAIHGELLAREARSMHLRIGETLQSIHSASLDLHLQELAHHFWTAQAWDEAYFYCRRAAERALTLNSPGAAAEQLARALDAATHLDVKPPAPLYRLQGQALEALGDFAGARASFEQSFACAQSAGDGRAEWQALLDLGFLWTGRDYVRSGEYFDHARSIAEKLGDPALKGRSLNRYGNWLANVGRCAEGIELHQQALAIFEGLDDLAGEAESLDLLGMCTGLYGDLPACAEHFKRAADACRRLDDKLTLASVLGSLGTFRSPALSEATHLLPAPAEEVIDCSYEAIRIADETGSLPVEAFVRFCGASVLSGFGRLSEAIEVSLDAQRLAEEAEHKQWLISARYTIGQAQIYALDYDGAINTIESILEYLPDLGSVWWTGNTRSHLARAYIQSGRLDAARRTLEGAQPMDIKPSDLGSRRVSLAWLELAAVEGRADDALTGVEALIASMPGARKDSCFPYLRQIRGDALVALGRNEEALAELEQARADAEALSAIAFLWPIHRSLGRAYAAAQGNAASVAAFAAAREVIERIAANITEESMRRRFLQAALGSLPPEKLLTQNQADKAAFGGLTAREREVAALISRGKSNRDIANELVLGERTIETHVSNVLAKLGFSSRAQVAAWAVDKGLLRLHD